MLLAVIFARLLAWSKGCVSAVEHDERSVWMGGRQLWLLWLGQKFQDDRFG